MTDTPTATTQPKTLEEKLVAAKAVVAKLEQQINAEKIKNDIAKGDAVTFLFGRGDKKRTMSGSVAGFADTPQGKIVAVLVEDETRLPETFRVNVAALLTNTSADARRTETAPATMLTLSPAPIAGATMGADGSIIDPLNVA